MTHVTNDGMAKFYKDQCPEKAAEIDAMDFDEITGGDLRSSIKSDVKWLKEQPYFNKEMGVTGAVFNLETGKAEVVQEA
jgi:carbonic anhydrase